MSLNTSKWLRPALINLNIVALLGCVLRYKIAFSLPFLDQKHLLHSHSHFSFGGWVSHALMVLMIEYLFRTGKMDAYKKYAKWLIINLVCAYGMLVSFTIQGYGLFSITFSTVSIAVAFMFGISYWIDLNKLDNGSIASKWFKAAIFFNMFSSLGAFSLSLMMATHTIHQNWYLASIYFFLHFQYNGWFFFVCMGLMSQYLLRLGVISNTNHKVFALFAISCIPAYFLSALWLPIPIWVYIIVALAALAQVFGWILFVKEMYTKRVLLRETISKQAKMLLIISAAALTIKLILQIGSVYPPLSNLAFSFRPIVIGYLHLVLLGVITVFLIGYSVSQNFIILNKSAYTGIFIFVLGIFLNEIILMFQGVNALRYESLPYSNEALIGAALVMFTGLFILNVSQFKGNKPLIEKIE